MPRVVLVDDEALARRGMRRLLARHPNVEIVGEADTLAAAIAVIEREKPDVVFLDLELPDAHGFDLLACLPSPPKVVIATAHAEHALQAFDIAAVDYLLKPISAARLAETMARLERAPSPAHSEPGDDVEPVLRLRTSSRVVVTPARRVIAASAEGDFSRLVIERLASLLVLQPLKQIERSLPSPPFLRLGRSLIVNSRCVSEIRYESRDRSVIALAGATHSLRLGRAATARLRAWATAGA